MDGEPDDQQAYINTLASSLAGAVSVGRNALAQIAMLRGPEYLDALEQKFLNDAKNATIEGVSMEEDVRLLNNIIATVGMIFAQAREVVADRFDQEPPRKRGGSS